MLDEHGARTGVTAPRSVVHRDGLLHRAVHVWLWYNGADAEEVLAGIGGSEAPAVAPAPAAAPGGGAVPGWLLLQQRAACKDSWAGRWDISSAGHVSAGQVPLDAAVRELEEELGVRLPATRFEFLFEHLERLTSEQRGRVFINNEFNDVFLITLTPAEFRALQPGAPGVVLQESEVAAIRWVPAATVLHMYETNDAAIVPAAGMESFRRLFTALSARGAAAPPT